jgi:hypothetical protein
MLRPIRFRCAGVWILTGLRCTIKTDMHVLVLTYTIYILSSFVQLALRWTHRTATCSAAWPHKQEHISISAAHKTFPCHICSSPTIYCDCSNVTTLEFSYMRQCHCVSAEHWTGFRLLIANSTSCTLHTFRAPPIGTTSLSTQFAYLRHLSSLLNHDTAFFANDPARTWIRKSPGYLQAFCLFNILAAVWGSENTLLILLRSPDRDKMSNVTVITLPFVSELPPFQMPLTRFLTQKFLSKFPSHVCCFLNTKISVPASFLLI